MNRRTLLSRALALLGAGAVAAPVVALAATDDGQWRPAWGGLETNKTTWRDTRGGLFWEHVDGWSWTHAEQTIIADDEHFHENLSAWASVNARKSFSIIGMDLRTYDILMRRNLVDKLGNYNLLLGKQVRVVNLAVGSRIDPSLEYAGGEIDWVRVTA